jgi:hypothetical protein
MTRNADVRTKAGRSSSQVRYLTNAEAAEYLRLSPRTLEKQRHFGGGPPYCKFGRAVRYALTDLESWAAARTFGMTADPRYPSLP